MIAEEIKKGGSLQTIADRLGVSITTIYLRAKKSTILQDLLSQRKRPPYPTLQNMIGYEVNGWKVIGLSEKRYYMKTPLWICIHSCGRQRLMAGNELRLRPPKTCKNCRYKRVIK